jgi:hypothetical protein
VDYFVVSMHLRYVLTEYVLMIPKLWYRLYVVNVGCISSSTMALNQNSFVRIQRSSTSTFHLLLDQL